MFLPIGTDRSLKRPTLVNHGLIAACIAVFLAQVASRSGGDLAAWEQAGLLKPADPSFWNFFSYQFMHDNFMHLLSNMLFLWVFGPNIEDRLGRLGHLGLFLIGGVAAGVAHLAFDNNPVLGASGSIAAITGAYMVFFPRTRIRVLLFFFLIGVYNIPSIWFIGFAIARDLFGLGIGGGNSGVAHLAHLGGYGFGFAVAMTLLATKVVSREPYDLLTLGKQAKRRRDFKAAAAAGHTPWAHEAPQRVQKQKKERPDPAREELAERRAAVATAVRAGDRDNALRLYKQLVEESPDAVMTRSVQLDLAGWLFERAEHAAADDAYERYLRHNGSDGEAHRVRLMSALIRGRYTNDPTGAATRLEEISPERLSEEERALYDALKSEAPS